MSLEYSVIKDEMIFQCATSPANCSGVMGQENESEFGLVSTLYLTNLSEDLTSLSPICWTIDGSMGRAILAISRSPTSSLILLIIAFMVGTSNDLPFAIHSAKNASYSGSLLLLIFSMSLTTSTIWSTYSFVT